jgi:hypothetical protein
MDCTEQYYGAYTSIKVDTNVWDATVVFGAVFR